MVEVYTSKGWEQLERLDGATCCDCPEPATELTPVGNEGYWAQCADCATESRCQDIDAERQADYDCEDDRFEWLPA